MMVAPRRRSLPQRGVSFLIITLLILVCFFLVSVPRIFRSIGSIIKAQSTTALKNINRCWMKHAFESGEFTLYSHRSYADSTSQQQPSCEESLLELKNIGVNHLDLDLVLESMTEHPRLIVGHPMEYKQISDYYSPCANSDFDDLVGLLKKVYGQEDFFISLEPKASWGKTEKELADVALTNLPSSILEKLLDAVRRNDLKGKCAAIVEINPAQDREELDVENRLLKEIMEYCQLFKGIGLSYGPLPQSMGKYDIIMPTIEFHPDHPHNAESIKRTIPKELWKTSVFWVVDNEENLDFAADLRPKGIVSNSPKNIVSIINDNKWCM